MKTNLYIIYFLTIPVIVTLWPVAARCNLVVFEDDFSTNTANGYTWFEEGNGGDGDPSNNYAYDAANEWLTITTADNNNIYMGTCLGASLITSLECGYFEFSFMPYQTYPTDGVTEMRLYGRGGEANMYVWHFAHDSAHPYAGDVGQYRARLEKWFDGTPVIQEIFIPSPDHYGLDRWHTLAMRFSPTELTGYLDGQLVMSTTDLLGSSILVEGFELVFMQQDQHVDNISMSVVPVPDAALLGTLGLLVSGWRLRRNKCTRPMSSRLSSKPNLRVTVLSAVGRANGRYRWIESGSCRGTGK